VTGGVELRPLDLADPLGDPALSRELAQRFCLFDPFVGGQRRVDLHPLWLDRDTHERAVAAAEGVARVVESVGARALGDDEEAAHYGLPGEVRRLAQASFQARDRASLVRVDLLLDEDGAFRVCEINADCPGGQNEATALPWLARRAGFGAGRDPSWVLDALADRVLDLARRDGETRAIGLLHATGYAEDLQVCALLQRALARRGARALLAPPTAPVLRGGALHLWGQELGAVYRFFPIEGMEGQRNVEGYIEAVGNGKLRSMSSFAQIYAQSKVSMARAWSRLGELGAADQEIIERHLPLTLALREVPAAALVADRRGWVLKRGLGRVGEQVFVGDLHEDPEWAEIVMEVVALELSGEPWIAQRYVPQRFLPTPWGPRLLTLGVYVQDGHFTGYFARLTPRSHVSHDALCVPVFTEPGEAPGPVVSLEVPA
jgi:hypothetical protein